MWRSDDRELADDTLLGLNDEWELERDDEWKLERDDEWDELEWDDNELERGNGASSWHASLPTGLFDDKELDDDTLLGLNDERELERDDERELERDDEELERDDVLGMLTPSVMRRTGL